MNNFKATIGLEVHCAITATARKLFSGGSNCFHAPNTELALIDVGMPGSLPIFNVEAALQAIRVCFALNMKVDETVRFDRKSYFYPDLPLGYQVTQFFKPIGMEGYLNIYKSDGPCKVRIRQLHLETDAGKTMQGDHETLIDFNRSGCPLMEIVTQPDLSNADDVILFVRMLKATVKATGASDTEMESGNFRVDVNISISKNDELGTRVEIKNLNSYKAIRQAIEHEIKRQTSVLTSGESVKQETRLFNEETSSTLLMREKEDAAGYLYFPDPDLPKFVLNPELVEAQKSIPSLPDHLAARLYNDLNMTENLINLVEDVKLAKFTEDCLDNLSKPEQIQALKIICGKMFAKLKDDSDIPINPGHIQELAKLALSDKPNEMVMKLILDEMWETGESAAEIMKRKGLTTIKDPQTLLTHVQKVINSNPNEVAKYKDGKHSLYGFFIGQVMKETKNLANAEALNLILTEELAKLS